MNSKLHMQMLNFVPINRVPPSFRLSLWRISQLHNGFGIF